MNRRKLIYKKLNHNTLKNKYYPLVFALLFSWVLQAQDIHYSQFYNAPLNLNPAMTGVFGGDVRLMGNYRQQWSPWVNYLTFSGAVDKKFYPKAPRNGFFSGGLTFNYDEAGDSKLQNIHLGLNGSYTQKLSDHAYITLGAVVSGNQRGFKQGALTFDQQFDENRGQFFDNLGTGENFGNTTQFFLDVGTGINFRIQELSDAELVDEQKYRSKLDVGIGIYHLTTPNQSFFEGVESPLFTRYSPYIAGTLQLGRESPLDVVTHFNGQLQGPYEEWLAMVGLKIHLETTPGKQFAIQPGVGYRFDEFGDAYYPTLEVNYRAWQVGLSWDVNVSEFTSVTNGNGGPEISVRYIFSKPLPKFKICPLI